MKEQFYKIENCNSWYESPLLTKKEYIYLKSLQKIFKVLDSERKLVPYMLTPHQVDWHRFDVALKKQHAPTRVCVKSRNTSFTTSALISNIMDAPSYPNQIKPFFRMNETRAIDLMKDTKYIIENMTPLLINGEYYPFNPRKVSFTQIKSGIIKFPNGCEFRAFPANTTAADNVRGLRVVGTAGIIDESEMMKCFEDIYIATRDTTTGANNKPKNPNTKHQRGSIFQMNIGTTLKGALSKFYLWYLKIKELDNPKIKIFYWPVFDPRLFNPNTPIQDQNLIPICEWHDLAELENKRKENMSRFLQEYMAQVGDDNQAFYSHNLIMQCINADLNPLNINPKIKDNQILYNESYKPPLGIYRIGIDVASVNDYFAISVFEKVGRKYIQRYLYYIRQIDLPIMQEWCIILINLIKPVLVRVDANGIGLQLSQKLQQVFGGIIEPIRGNNIKGMTTKQSISLNEYMHTNMKQMMLDKEIELLPDDLQVIHYGSWDYSFKAESTSEYGHGDITIANCLALLPVDYKMSKMSISAKKAYKPEYNSATTEIINNNIPDVNW